MSVDKSEENAITDRKEHSEESAYKNTFNDPFPIK